MTKKNKKIKYLYSVIVIKENKSWGCSSIGRALKVLIKGTGFDSSHLHQKYFLNISFV